MVVGASAANSPFVRTLRVRPQILAAVYKNDRFSRCVAALESTLK